MIGYEKSGKTMDKKGWCGDNFSDAAVPEKLFINFFWPNKYVLSFDIVGPTGARLWKVLLIGWK